MTEYLSWTNHETMYWYARGYYAGRSEGVSELLDIGDEYRYAYKCGYDVGVSDYCDSDISVDNEEIEV